MEGGGGGDKTSGITQSPTFMKSLLDNDRSMLFFFKLCWVFADVNNGGSEFEKIEDNGFTEENAMFVCVCVEKRMWQWLLGSWGSRFYPFGMRSDSAVRIFVFFGNFIWLLKTKIEILKKYYKIKAI